MGLNKPGIVCVKVELNILAFGWMEEVNAAKLVPIRGRKKTATIIR